MSTRRAVVAGASGFVGRHLVQDLSRRGYSVGTIGRAHPRRPAAPTADWDDRAGVDRLVDGADLLVNLAGRSVGCRYTDANREEILTSRTETTHALHRAVAAATDPPRLWLNASTATIYRHATDRAQTEDDGELGTGFSVDVARGWEDALFAGDLPGTRRVAMRMAIVLGDGPAVMMLARAARSGLGGPQLDGWWFRHDRYRGIGDSPTPAHPTGHRTRGEQRFSWIHLNDLLAAIAFLDEHDDLTGPVNLASPGVATNRELMAALRRAVGAPFGLPAPRWLLEPGMLVLRQESELVLKSRWVVPQRLERAGFTFRWQQLEHAVRDVVGS